MQKNLRKEAFLRIYHSDKKGVTAWEEVQKDKFPTKVEEKLGVKSSVICDGGFSYVEG